jgi:threonine dehydrogenase-like Zn-dependent dehydrogenase
MRALVYTGRKLRYDAGRPVPEPGENEALVRVLKAGICNTDVEITKGYLDFTGVLGHEFTGVVEESSHADLVGKRVVGEINLPCDDCPYCVAGLRNHCPNRTVLGIDGKDGVLADYVTLPNANLHVVPDEISDDEAVFIEPLASCFEITDRVPISRGDRVVVLGDGKIGLLAVQVIAIEGTNPVLVGLHPHKMKVAEDRGIRTLVFGVDDPGRADIVIDATGSRKGFEAAAEIVEPRGTIVLKSTVAGATKMNLAKLVINEITLVGSRCGPFATAIKHLSSHLVSVTPLISRRFPLDAGVEAFKAAQKPDAIKVFVETEDAVNSGS